MSQQTPATGKMAKMAKIPRNSAFGSDAPSWNLAFPDGNLTAAEILAYLPHWLKSLDVIDRFVSNGARAFVVAAMVNEFREQPLGQPWSANSASIMMSYQMRRGGYKNWTVGTHHDYARENALAEGDLNVKNFRTPRITHPKGIYTSSLDFVASNSEAPAINFRNLALNVKRHPSGADALDLTRCVQYALENVEEDWMFPTDFANLTFHLGGPQLVTHSHLDRQIFERRADAVPPPKSTTGRSPRIPFGRATITRTAMSTSRIGRARTRLQALTPSKRAADDLGRVQVEGKRRSTRLVGKVKDMREDSDAEENDDSSVAGSVYKTPPVKRLLFSKPAKTAATVSPRVDSDFTPEESELEEEVTPVVDEASDDEDFAPARRPRAAARKARNNIQASLSYGNPYVLNPPVNPTMLYQQLKPTPSYITAEIAPELIRAATDFAKRKPIRLNPPILSEHRLKVDPDSIYLYAAEGCTSIAEMWATALSSTRFGGPRRHAPFRELHRLSDPDIMDTSDWAENIRWAKEQYKEFGSQTWTEYDYHLECITEHRRATFWVSEEAIMAGF